MARHKKNKGTIDKKKIENSVENITENKIEDSENEVCDDNSEDADTDELVADENVSEENLSEESLEEEFLDKDINETDFDEEVSEEELPDSAFSEEDEESEEREIIIDEEFGYEDDADEYQDGGEDEEPDYEVSESSQKRKLLLDMLDDDIEEEIKHRNRKKKPVGIIAAWIVFVLLCASYVYVFFVRQDKEEKIPGKDNTVILDIPDGATYRKCDIAEINQLINNYLLARVNCNQTTLKTLVTNPAQFDDMTSLQQAATYICGYNETTCYIADGYDENSYIVIELSYLKIADVQSQPLDIMSFYVVRGADGSYKIDNSELTSEVENYITRVKSEQDIQDIYIHVKENNEYLVNTDAEFADFCNLINK